MIGKNLSSNICSSSDQILEGLKMYMTTLRPPQLSPKFFEIGTGDTKFRWKSCSNHFNLKVSSSLERDSASIPTTMAEDVKCVDMEGQFRYLASENGWQVRRMVEKEEEMREVVQVQAQAFHQPVLLFDDLFFQFFQAEVLAGLLYRLRNSPSDRYACLIAESPESNSESRKLAGVADITVLRDTDVLQHLPVGIREYVYVSGIAVFQDFRRQKVATALLKGCETMSVQWGYECLVLRAYEDDLGARKLYANAGYQMVSNDPPWISTWIGRRRRVLMIKRSAR